MQSELIAQAREDLSEDFKKEFIACASRLREAPYTSHISGDSYVRQLMNTAVPSLYMLVQSNGLTVGRAAVFASASQSDTASVGLYEVDLRLQHAIIAHTLLAAARAWARERGRAQLIGPLDINTWYNYRFRVDTDPRAWVWEPFQPLAYVAHWRSFGFQTLEHYVSLAVKCPYRIIRLPFYLAARKARKAGFTTVPFSQNWAENRNLLYELGVDSFSKNFLYEGISREAFDLLYAEPKLDYSASIFLLDQAGKVGGFALNFTHEDQLVIKTLGIRSDLRSLALGRYLLYTSFTNAGRRGLAAGIGALMKTSGRTNEWTRLFHKFRIVTAMHEYEILSLDIG